MLCKYKNALGIPGKGIHQHVFGIAIADCIMTIIGAWLFSTLFHWNFGYTLLGLFIVGIVLHRLFCVSTTIDQILFKN